MTISRLTAEIEELTITQISEMQFKGKFASALIMTCDNKILLQKRSVNAKNFPGFITTFGGKIELHETPKQALMRELNEELGAQTHPSDLIECGAVTDAKSEYTDLIYAFFWHDVHGNIEFCTEENPIYFTNTDEILQHPQSMVYVRWLVKKCIKLGLLLPNLFR